MLNIETPGPYEARPPRTRHPAVLALLLSVVAALGCESQGTDPDPTEAGTVEVSPARLFLEEGLQWDLVAAARTNGGLPSSRPVAWTTSDARVVRVDEIGRVTAVAPGEATVTARLDRASGTADVTVVGDGAALPFTSEGSLDVVPGSVWSLTGTDLGDLSVTIGSIPAEVAVVADSLASVQLPALDAFGPCLPASLPVALRTPEWVAVVSAPGKAPLRVEIAPGERVALDAAVRHGCEIVAPAGDYVVAAVVVDDAATMRRGELVPDSVTLDVWAEDPAAPRVHERSAMRIAAPRLRPPDLIPHSSGPGPLLGSAAEGSESCRVAEVVGDSVLLPTGRDEQGRYDWGAPTEDEWWYLVAQTPHLNLVVDSTGARVWGESAYLRGELGSVMGMYETEWLPIWDELYEDPLPDRDGNGRLIMRAAWNSAVGGGGGSGEYAQTDCPGGWRAGEEFYVPLDVFSDDPDRAPWYLRAYHRAVVQHEAGHTHDLARRYATWGQHTYTSQVAAEGIASFATTYWLLDKRAEPLLGNHRPAEVALLLDNLMFETGAWQIFPDISHTYQWTAWADAGGYGQSVQFITWVAAQAVRAGKPASSVLSGLVHASDARTTYGSIYRDATGESAEAADDAEVLVRWALSWIVDDEMEDPPPELTIPTWNTAAAYEDAAARPRPGPDVVLDGAGGAVVELGEPDVALLKLTGSGPRRFGISVTDRGAADRLHVQILRTR